MPQPNAGALRTRAISRSTWAIGVSGSTPWPRLKMNGPCEAIRQNLDDAFADDISFLGGELFEDTEHQLLLAHR